MRPYKPSGAIPISSLLTLLIGAIFGGVILGVIFFGISQVIYLILLFPILMGLAAGFIVAATVDLGKIRNPLIAMFFAILLAGVTYGTLRYAEYYSSFAVIYAPNQKMSLVWNCPMKNSQN